MDTALNSQIFNTVQSCTNVQDFQLQQNTSYLNTQSRPDEFIKNPDNNTQEDTKKAKKSKKPLVIAGLTLAGIAAGASYILLKRNFRPANFEENVKFIKASTMDEAKDFAKKHFKVQEFDFGDDIEFANWVNEGLTNINNRFKGKAHMPKVLAFSDDSNILSDSKVSKGLAITNGFKQAILFDEKALTKEALLEDFLKKTDVMFGRTKDGKVELKTALIVMDAKKTKELGVLWDKVDKSRNNADAISRFDLLTGIFKYEDYASVCLNPSGTMYTMLDNKKIMKIFNDKGVKLDLDKFLKLDNKKQIQYIKDKCTEAGIERLYLPGSKRGNSEFDILNHEMGHLQHYGTRTLFDDTFGRLSNKSTESFKTDRNAQKVAGKISWYAQKDPLEFVAETFNAMISGVKISDEVMDLYKYYKGPIIPNMA